MEVLIAYLLGLIAGGTFDSHKIKVYGVGCNAIIHDIKQEQFTKFLCIVGCCLAFCFAIFMIYSFARIISYTTKRGLYM